MRSETISVLIPAYNESCRIKPTLAAVAQYLAAHWAEYEIVVVDDGSSDDTAEIVAGMAATLRNVHLISTGKNRGKGHAVRSGVFAAKGDLILMTDADLSTPIEHLADLVAAIEAGNDIAFGSRKACGANVVRRQQWYREKMGNIFNLVVRMLGLTDFRDTQCGFKLMKRLPGQRLFGKCICDRFSFDVEFLFLARKEGFALCEVPVTWSNSPQSRVRIGIDSLNMLLDLLRIRLCDLVGGYRRTPASGSE